MNCKEAINLWGSYRDGELDAAFCREIRSHLEACEECRSFFEAQHLFDVSLTQALKQGQSSQALWQREMSAVRAAIQRPNHPRPAATSFLRLWLWPSPRFYLAMAALWALLLGVNRLADMGGPVGGMNRKPGPRYREALAEQRRELRALFMATEHGQALAAEHGLAPRSDRAPGPQASPIGRTEHEQEIIGHRAELS